jgi:hypothetical protein
LDVLYFGRFGAGTFWGWDLMYLDVLSLDVLSLDVLYVHLRVTLPQFFPLIATEAKYPQQIVCRFTTLSTECCGRAEVQF